MKETKNAPTMVPVIIKIASSVSSAFARIFPIDRAVSDALLSCTGPVLLNLLMSVFRILRLLSHSPDIPHAIRKCGGPVYFTEFSK